MKPQISSNRGHLKRLNNTVIAYAQPTLTMAPTVSLMGAILYETNRAKVGLKFDDTGV